MKEVEYALQSDLKSFSKGFTVNDQAQVRGPSFRLQACPTCAYGMPCRPFPCGSNLKAAVPKAQRAATVTREPLT